MFSLQFALTTGILIQCVLTLYLCLNKKKDDPQPIEQEKPSTPKNVKENVNDSPKKLLKLKEKVITPVTPYFINKEKNLVQTESKVFLKRNLTQPFEELNEVQRLEHTEVSKKLKTDEQKKQKPEIFVNMKTEEKIQNNRETVFKDEDLDLKEIWKKVNKKEIKRSSKFCFQYQRNDRVDTSVDALDEKYCLIKGIQSSQEEQQTSLPKTFDIDISFSARDKESPESAQKPLIPLITFEQKEQNNTKPLESITLMKPQIPDLMSLFKFPDQPQSLSNQKEENQTADAGVQPSFMKKTKSKLNLFENSKIEGSDDA